jgi:NitT/TauT family transport system substrate-binding protein
MKLRSIRLARAIGVGLLASGLAAACGPAPAAKPAAPAAPPTTAASAPAAPPAASAPAPAGAPAASTPASKPILAAAPPLTLKVGVLPVTSWAPLFVAQDRGYFKEVGLDLDLSSFPNYATQVPLLAQGQLHVAGCSNAVICFNAFGRDLDVRVVGDLQSAGKTDKSKGSSGLVVRKDLYDDGTIRGPRDLVGRNLNTQAGPGSGQHAQGIRWLQRAGVDPASMDWPLLGFPDLFAAMQNKGAEVGFQSEPFTTMGTSRGVHHVLATSEEMHPTTQTTYVMYWTGIDQLGPQAGERFMVGFQRGGRDFTNAMEYGVDQDAIIELLTRETTLKDAAVYRQIKYPWRDPNGVVDRESLQGDAELFAEAGLMPKTDISGAFDDKYRRFSVDYLGEYQPPR